MKIFGVLAILSTLYTQGTSLTCKKVETFSDPTSIVPAETDETCGDTVTTCVRPIMKDDGTYEAAGSKWGCGECTPVASCVSCTVDNCNVAPTFTCLATDDFTQVPESTVCPDRVPTGSAFEPETKCVRPKLDGTYMTDGTTWGCGVCETTDNCIDACSTADCNIKPVNTCHKYTVSSGAWMKNGQVDCEEVQGCHLPTPDSVTTEEDGTVYNSCGDCDSLAEGVCKKCTGVDCNDIEDHVYCKKGANDAVLADLKQNFCADGVTSCQRPEFSYAVVGDVEYGCGNCKDGSDDIANCETCSESDCNSIPTDPKHKCYTYSFNDEEEKWAASADTAVCVSGDGVAGKCNMPADLAVKAGYTEGGCGPCKVDNAACKVTEAEKNVGQKAVVSLLVTILPLLYVML